jgi:hypothetical protein
MTKKVTLALAVISVFLISGLSAQNSNFYFTGVGRALVTNDQLTDNTKTDSRLKASSGYTLFDLGIYGKASDVLRGGVILRTRNEFGGFFSDGASLSFRQMQLEGLISKKVKYEIGDIYLTHTPYTLWNDENVIGYSKYESNLFSLRRSIVNYENFYVDNAWRMQGVNASGRINFTKGAESLGIRAYGGRTRQTDFATIPDRYFFGARLDLVQSKYLRIAANIARVSDIPNTVKTPAITYDNKVYTSDFNLNLTESDQFKLSLLGEAGASSFQLQRKADSSDKRFNDYFYDMGVKANYKPLDFNFGVNYRNVGFNFNSPMAQSRRMLAPGGIALNTFPTMNDGSTQRSISTFDAYVQEKGMYNPGISTTLMNYYIQYDIVEPYGKATPNRKGFTFSADIKKPDELINASFDISLLSEITSEGDSVTSSLRKFTKMRGGFVFNLNKLMKFEKTIAINVGFKSESSNRSGTNPVNLSNRLIDVGLDLEVLKSLHLLGGVKLFSVNGNEVTSGRNQVNQISAFTPVTFDQKQNIIATGLRYDYDKAGYFSMHYHMVKVDQVNFDKHPNTNTNYSLNQLFFVFGLKF